jgi:hypothetical protein
MPKKRPTRTGSPIDRNRRELLDKERELKRRMDGVRKMLDDAPRLREEVAKREREHLVIRTQSRSRRTAGPESLDHRLRVHSPVAKGRSTKIEKQRAKLQFYALLILLAVAVVILLQFLPAGR